MTSSGEYHGHCPKCSAFSDHSPGKSGPYTVDPVPDHSHLPNTVRLEGCREYQPHQVPFHQIYRKCSDDFREYVDYWLPHIESKCGLRVFLRIDERTNKVVLEACPGDRLYGESISPAQHESVQILAWEHLGLRCIFNQPPSENAMSTEPLHAGVETPTSRGRTSLLPLQSQARCNSTIPLSRRRARSEDSQEVSRAGTPSNAESLDGTNAVLDAEFDLNSFSEDGYVTIGNINSLRPYFRIGFERVQQIPCKEIAKQFIKHIQPDKQALYPYRSNKKRKQDFSNSDKPLEKPRWWPPNTSNQDYIEPDHMKKSTRLDLLVHIMLLPLINMASCKEALNGAKRKCGEYHPTWVSMLRCAVAAVNLRDSPRKDPSPAAEAMAEERMQARDQILQQMLDVAAEVEDCVEGCKDEGDQRWIPAFPTIPSFLQHKKAKHESKSTAGKGQRDMMPTVAVEKKKLVLRNRRQNIKIDDSDEDDEGKHDPVPPTAPINRNGMDAPDEQPLPPITVPSLDASQWSGDPAGESRLSGLHLRHSCHEANCVDVNYQVTETFDGTQASGFSRLMPRQSGDWWNFVSIGNEFNPPLLERTTDRAQFGNEAVLGHWQPADAEFVSDHPNNILPSYRHSALIGTQYTMPLAMQSSLIPSGMQAGPPNITIKAPYEHQSNGFEVNHHVHLASNYPAGHNQDVYG